MGHPPKNIISYNQFLKQLSSCHLPSVLKFENLSYDSLWNALRNDQCIKFLKIMYGMEYSDQRSHITPNCVNCTRKYNGGEWWITGIMEVDCSE